MRVHVRETIKRNFEFSIFLGVCFLFLVSVVFHFKTLRQSKTPLIIAIDANGARLVSEPTDPIFKTEAIAFIRKFFFNSYNFDSTNFIRRVGLATTFMSEDLWKRKQQEILDLKTKVEREQIQLQTDILKITQDEQGLYHVLLDVKETNRLNQQSHQIRATVQLTKVDRTPNNPYGLEVASYEEVSLPQ